MANVCRCICDVEQFARLPQLKAAMEEAHHLMERIENVISLWAGQGMYNAQKYIILHSIPFLQLILFGATRLGWKLIKDYDIFQLQFDRGIAISSAANINLVIKLQRM